MDVNAMMDQIRRNFTPGGPIQSEERLQGRTEELQSLVSTCGNQGQHAIIFGERSIGKTSLANIAAKLAQKRFPELKLVRCGCDSETTFNDLASRICHKLGTAAVPSEMTTSAKAEGTLTIKAGFVDGAVKADETQTTKFTTLKLNLTPSVVAEVVGEHHCLILLDEFDLVQSADDRKRVAQFLKSLSDVSETATVFITGIGRSVHELLEGHESLVRNLNQIRVPKIKDFAIRRIIESGADQCGLLFDPFVLQTITAHAGGYPYFAHLLGGKSAEEAVNQRTTHVEQKHFDSAVSALQRDKEVKLLQEWREAIHPPGQGSNGHIIKVLVSASKLALMSKATDDFTPVDLASFVLQNYGDRALSDMRRTLDELSSKPDSILRHDGKGYYRFRNPLMPPFIKLLRYGEQ